MKKLIFLLLISLLFANTSIAETKKATLINEYGDKVVVTVNSQEAQGYFGLGFYLYTEESFGAVASTPALFRTNLASKITEASTEMTLVSATTRDGTDLSGSVCFTIDGSLSIAEYVCGIASGTSITALERGLGSDGVTEYTALKFEHRYGAVVKITDFPVIQRHSNIINGTSDFPSGITANGDLIATGGTVEFENAVILASSTTPTLDNHLATKKYADDLALAGAPDATESVKGISELATQAEMALGTDTGSTGANLVLQSKYASSSRDVAGTAVVVTDTDGYINQNRLDLTEDFTFASTTFSASTTWEVLPEYDSDPTSDNEATRKSYVDTEISDNVGNIILVTASDTLQASSAVEKSDYVQADYEKFKDIEIYKTGSIRVKFDAKGSNIDNHLKFRVYKNGVAIGTIRTPESTSYITYSEDFSGIVPFDNIQIYATTDSYAYTTYVENFQIYYTETSYNLPVNILD